MKNNKHTPGPWTVETVPRMLTNIQTNVKSQVDEYYIRGEYIVATTILGSEANARLIAAAPEMLEALESFTLGFSSLVNSEVNISSTVRDYLQNAFEETTKAIAKARGES